MRQFIIAHILLIAFGAQVLLGGAGRVVVCFGVGHEHEPVEVGQCESLSCSHDSGWPISLPVTDHDHDHDEDCDCTDLEFEVSELPTTTPRVDPGTTDVQAAAPSAAWDVLMTRASLSRRGPPTPPPPWFDPAGEHRIILVSSTVLTI